MSAARLWLLTAVTMTAFAANSILNRLAVGEGHIDALSFAVIRVLAGAAILSAIVLLRGGRPALPPARRWIAAGGLSLYLLGFSVAYAHIDAGLGALILFGGVQVTMFALGLLTGEAVPPRRYVGAAGALSGLALLVWPSGAGGVPVIGVVAMLFAALGWGGYSFLGKGSRDPLPETAASFLIAIPLVWLPVLMMPVAPDAMPASGTGYALAILSGAVTSGLGYALWYTVLPRLGASVGALVQLSAPVIAVAGGVVLLGEAASFRLVVATVVILGSIAYGIGGGQRRIGSSGS